MLSGSDFLVKVERVIKQAKANKWNSNKIIEELIKIINE